MPKDNLTTSATLAKKLILKDSAKTNQTRPYADEFEYEETLKRPEAHPDHQAIAKLVVEAGSLSLHDEHSPVEKKLPTRPKKPNIVHIENPTSKKNNTVSSTVKFPPEHDESGVDKEVFYYMRQQGNNIQMNFGATYQPMLLLPNDNLPAVTHKNKK